MARRERRGKRKISFLVVVIAVVAGGVILSNLDLDDVIPRSVIPTESPQDQDSTA